MSCRHIFLRRYNDVSKELTLECIRCGYKIVLLPNGEKYEFKDIRH